MPKDGLENLSEGSTMLRVCKIRGISRPYLKVHEWHKGGGQVHLSTVINVPEDLVDNSS